MPKRIEPLGDNWSTRCPEPVRNGGLGRHAKPDGRQCAHMATFTLDGKPCCRWHAMAIAFDTLKQEEARDGGK